MTNKEILEQLTKEELIDVILDHHENVPDKNTITTIDAIKLIVKIKIKAKRKLYLNILNELKKEGNINEKTRI